MSGAPAPAACALDLEALLAGPAGLLEGPARTLVVDDADRLLATAGAKRAAIEETLFHLYNALAGTGAMLLTARQPAARWPIALADLRSRLRAAPAAAIDRPDDALLAAVMVKLFADRQLRVGAEVITFLVARMERSFAAAAALVEALDRAALADRRAGDAAAGARGSGTPVVNRQCRTAADRLAPAVTVPP